MEKAAIYCRLSEEDRGKLHASDDSASIQNQKTMLTQYAMERGWEVYRIYSDDDYAGADRSRPAFQKLLADAEAHRFDIILCKTQSRFTRELELVERYIHQPAAERVSYRCVCALWLPQRPRAKRAPDSGPGSGVRGARGIYPFFTGIRERCDCPDAQ